MLIDYQHEYRTNLNTDMTQGIGSQRWINYQQFIQTLEKAIEQHRQQLNQWTQSRYRAEFLAREKQRLQARKPYRTGRLQPRPRRKTVWIRKMDEFAQRASMRKPE